MGDRAISFTWRIIASICRCMSKALRSNSPNGANSPGGGAGLTVTLGATLPTYSTFAIEPSGSGTVMVWVSRLAASAAPVSVTAPRPARMKPRALGIGILQEWI